MEYIIGKLLQDYEHGKMTRRQLIQTLALTATAASAGAAAAQAASPANAIAINHVSMQVADYTKTRDFTPACSAWRSATMTRRTSAASRSAAT